MLPTMKSRLSNLVDDFLGRDLVPEFTTRPGISTPSVNILEKDNEYDIEVAAPGLEKEDFKIDVENDVLTVSSQKEDVSEEKNEKFMRREFSFSSFQRSFILPDSADTDQIKATHKNGVLRIQVPKKEESKKKAPKQVSIE